MDSKNKVRIYDVLSNLSDCNAEIRMTMDALYLFGEQLDSEIEMLHNEGRVAVDYFMNRYRLLCSLLSVIENQLADTASSMADTVQDIKCIMQK